MKNINKRNFKIILVSIVAYIAISKFAPLKLLLNLWHAYVELNPSIKMTLNLATAGTIFAIVFCIIGCMLDLRKKKMNCLAKEKLDTLEQIVELAKSTINDYEERMLQHYYYINHTTAGKLAPAKWILISLEKRLKDIYSVMQASSGYELNSYLDEEIELNSSAVNVIVFSPLCHKLPENLNLVECALILNEIFNSVKADLNQAEIAALKTPQFAFNM